MLFYEASATDGKKISYPFFSSQKAIFTHLFGKIYMEIEFSPNIGNKPYWNWKKKVYEPVRKSDNVFYASVWIVCKIFDHYHEGFRANFENTHFRWFCNNFECALINEFNLFLGFNSG